MSDDALTLQLHTPPAGDMGSARTPCAKLLSYVAILPWVRVPLLGSHLLGRVTARLSLDWQSKYGHPICLVETFVERERFGGICYRAAGWLPVGLTSGRTRNDQRHKAGAPVKAVYLKPLLPDWKRRLVL